MPNMVVRLLLFLSSYFPLALILFFLLREARPVIASGVLGVGLLGVAGMALYLFVVRSLNPLTIEIASVIRRDGEAMSYIVTYLVPFLAAPFGSLEEGIGLGIFFIMLAVLYVNSDMIHINPMLNLVGYHVYEIELANGEVRSLIARRRVRRGQQVSVVSASTDVMLEVKER